MPTRFTDIVSSREALRQIMRGDQTVPLRVVGGSSGP